jgi:putative ABC transport system permease protein
MNDYGLGQGRFGRGALDHLMTLPQFRVVPRPLLIALRNTFRRKARLAMTLLTMTMASTVFVGVLGARASILRTFDLEMSIWQYDVTINFSHTQRIEQLRREAMRVPGVVAAESWNYQPIHRLRTSGNLSREMTLIALPAATTMLKPILVEGRWLLPDDDNAVVINIAALKANPDVKIGDEIQLKFKNQRPTRWRVVGIVMGVIAGPMLYIDQPYFAHLTNHIDRAETVQIVAAPQRAENPSQTNAAFQAQMAKTLETHFEQAGLQVASTVITADRRGGFTQLLNIFTIIFSLTSILLAVVGALGLTGTMSINILERTREIGVMRTIGASDGMVQQMVLAEGIFIGLLSWGCGTLLAWPLGQIVNWLTGTYLLRTPLQYTFSTGGALLWLSVVIFLAVVASYLPARAASHLPVSELLAYE